MSFAAFLAGCASDTVEHGSGEWTHAHRRDDPLRLAEWRAILEQAEARTEQIGAEEAEQYPVKGRAVPSTMGSLPASPPATSPEGEAHRATAEETKPACPDCGGSGTVAVHVCEDERECARTCLRVEACAACGSSGRKTD